MPINRQPNQREVREQKRERARSHIEHMLGPAINGQDFERRAANLARNKNPFVRAELPWTEGIHADIIRQLSTDPVIYVRLSVARGRYTPIEVIKEMAASDPIYGVRNAAGKRLSRILEMKEKKRN